MVHRNNNSNIHGNSKCNISNTTHTIDNDFVKSNVFNGHVNNDNFKNVYVNDNENYDIFTDL